MPVGFDHCWAANFGYIAFKVESKRNEKANDVMVQRVRKGN